MKGAGRDVQERAWLGTNDRVADPEVERAVEDVEALTMVRVAMRNRREPARLPDAFEPRVASVSRETSAPSGRSMKPRSAARPKPTSST